MSYLYSNQIVVSIKTIESVIICAKELGIEKLIEMCEKSLLKFDKKYILQVLQISRNCKLKTSYYHAFWYICTHFDVCINLSYFIKLDSSLILELIDNYTITSRDEVLLLQRILAWIEANKETKIDQAIILLNVIDISKINVDQFEIILRQNNFVLHLPECLKLLKEKIRFA